jgi:hypothetical protein
MSRALADLAPNAAIGAACAISSLCDPARR